METLRSHESDTDQDKEEKRHVDRVKKYLKLKQLRCVDALSTTFQLLLNCL